MLVRRAADPDGIPILLESSSEGVEKHVQGRELWHTSLFSGFWGELRRLDNLEHWRGATLRAAVAGPEPALTVDSAGGGEPDCEATMRFHVRGRLIAVASGKLRRTAPGAGRLTVRFDEVRTRDDLLPRFSG